MIEHDISMHYIGQKKPLPTTQRNYAQGMILYNIIWYLQLYIQSQQSMYKVVSTSNAYLVLYDNPIATCVLFYLMKWYLFFIKQINDILGWLIQINT